MEENSVYSIGTGTGTATETSTETRTSTYLTRLEWHTNDCLSLSGADLMEEIKRAEKVMSLILRGKADDDVLDDVSDGKKGKDKEDSAGKEPLDLSKSHKQDDNPGPDPNDAAVAEAYDSDEQAGAFDSFFTWKPILSREIDRVLGGDERLKRIATGCFIPLCRLIDEFSLNEGAIARLFPENYFDLLVQINSKFEGFYGVVEEIRKKLSAEASIPGLLATSKYELFHLVLERAIAQGKLSYELLDDTEKYTNLAVLTSLLDESVDDDIPRRRITEFLRDVAARCLEAGNDGQYEDGLEKRVMRELARADHLRLPREELTKAEAIWDSMRDQVWFEYQPRTLRDVSPGMADIDAVWDPELGMFQVTRSPELEKAAKHVEQIGLKDRLQRIYAEIDLRGWDEILQESAKSILAGSQTSQDRSRDIVKYFGDTLMSNLRGSTVLEWHLYLKKLQKAVAGKHPPSDPEAIELLAQLKAYLFRTTAKVESFVRRPDLIMRYTEAVLKLGREYILTGDPGSRPCLSADEIMAAAGIECSPRQWSTLRRNAQRILSSTRVRIAGEGVALPGVHKLKDDLYQTRKGAKRNWNRSGVSNTRIKEYIKEIVTGSGGAITASDIKAIRERLIIDYGLGSYVPQTRVREAQFDGISYSTVKKYLYQMKDAGEL